MKILKYENFKKEFQLQKLSIIFRVEENQGKFAKYTAVVINNIDTVNCYKVEKRNVRII